MMFIGEVEESVRIGREEEPVEAVVQNQEGQPGQQVVQKSFLRGFFCDPSLFLVNGPDASPSQTQRSPFDIPKALRTPSCQDCDAGAMLLNACYDLVNPDGMQWALWRSECIKNDDPTFGLDFQTWENTPGDWLFCDYDNRVQGGYSGYHVPNYTLANHNVDYVGIWLNRTEGGDLSVGLGMVYIEADEKCIMGCAQLVNQGDYWYWRYSDLLGYAGGWICDAGYPGVVFDLGTLTAGQTYVFYAYGLGNFQPYMGIHRGVNNVTWNWQNRNEADYFATGAVGGGVSQVYTAPVTGRFGVIVGQWNMGTPPQDTFGVGFYPYYANMLNETPISITQGALGRWVQPAAVQRWAVVGTKPDVREDFDVRVKVTHDINTIWNPYIYAYSTEDSGITDFVMINYHNNFGNAITGVDWFAEFNKYQCYRGTSVTAEWCQNHGVINTIGTYGPYSYTANQVAWSWDIYPYTNCAPSDTTGTIIEIDITSGSIDLGLGIANPSVGDFQGRYQLSVIRDASGPGVDEIVVWNPPTSGVPYGLVVFSENFQAGTFQIIYRCPTPLYDGADENPDGIPNRFYARPIGSAFQDRLLLEIGLPSDSRISLTLYSSDGRVALTDGFDLEAGIHRIQKDISGLAPGVYFLWVSAGEDRASGKVMIR